MTRENNNHLIIYQENNSLLKINVRFADEDVWLTQGQLAEIATHKKYLLVRQEGNRSVQRNIDHYKMVKQLPKHK